MKLLDVFAGVASTQTNYFIIDSGNYEKDNDYIERAWQRDVHIFIAKSNNIMETILR